MKLLVVMASCPFPPRVGSAIVACNNIREIAKNHSVSLICLDIARELGDFGKSFEQVEFVPPTKHSRFIQLVRYGFYTLRGIPTFVIANRSRLMEMRVRQLLENHDFDAILLYEISAIQYCPPSSYQKVIANVEDPLSIKHNRMNELPVWSFWQKMKLSVNERLASRFEKIHFPRLAKVLLLSETDKQAIQEQGGYENIGCVSYGVDRQPPEAIAAYEERTEGMIVYSGSMFHPPNVDGALFFLQSIFPLVLDEYPTAVLWIVGADPDRRIFAAAERFKEHVVITGRVPDLSAYLRQALVSVCPVRLKIGVQTKILEAFSWGTPVVTTSAGNSGICGSSGRDLWVEDDPGMFAGRVAALLRRERWEQFSARGRAFGEDRFSWERSAREIEQHIEGLSAKAGCSGISSP